jgi:hypothetical protein
MPRAGPSRLPIGSLGLGRRVGLVGGGGRGDDSSRGGWPTTSTAPARPSSSSPTPLRLSPRPSQPLRTQAARPERSGPSLRISSIGPWASRTADAGRHPLLRSSPLSSSRPAVVMTLSSASWSANTQRRTLADRSTQHHQHRPVVPCTAFDGDGSPDLPPPPPETPGPPPAPPSDGTAAPSSSTKVTAPPVTVISHTSPPPHPHTIRASLLSTYPRSLARLGALLPSTPFALDPHHRPSKADLLRLTDSAWERARIRWKWLTIRGFRRFNVDDWGAVFSWVLVGNIGWLVLGTGSFFGMLLLTANTFSLQGAYACALHEKYRRTCR